MTSDKIKNALSRIQAVCESDDLLETCARLTIARQRGDRPSDHWSLRNQIIMISQLTDDARGFRQWKEADRYPKKGSHAFSILSPRYDKEDDKAYFVPVPVFRLEDTDGKPIEYPDYKPPVLPPLSDLPSRLGIEVEYRPSGGDSLGFYMPSRRKITLKDHSERVFFHELAHGLHDGIQKLKNGQDPFQEIVAEAVSGVLLILYSFQDQIGNCQQYIKHYSGSVKIQTVIPTVEKILSEIFPTEKKISLAEAA